MFFPAAAGVTADVPAAAGVTAHIPAAAGVTADVTIGLATYNF